jgi:hypothetical protein
MHKTICLVCYEISIVCYEILISLLEIRNETKIQYLADTTIQFFICLNFEFAEIWSDCFLFCFYICITLLLGYFFFKDKNMYRYKR